MLALRFRGFDFLPAGVDFRFRCSKVLPAGLVFLLLVGIVGASQCHYDVVRLDFVRLD